MRRAVAKMRMSSSPLVQPWPLNLVAVGVERQRDEGVVAGRAALRLAQHDQVFGPFLERLDRAVQHRRVGGDADAVRHLVDLEPVGRVDLVRADELAETLAEHFGAAAVDVVEAGLAQAARASPRTTGGAGAPCSRSRRR